MKNLVDRSGRPTLLLPNVCSRREVADVRTKQKLPSSWKSLQWHSTDDVIQSEPCCTHVALTSTNTTPQRHRPPCAPGPKLRCQVNLLDIHSWDLSYSSGRESEISDLRLSGRYMPPSNTSYWIHWNYTSVSTDHHFTLWTYLEEPAEFMLEVSETLENMFLEVIDVGLHVTL